MTDSSSVDPTPEAPLEGHPTEGYVRWGTSDDPCAVLRAAPARQYRYRSGGSTPTEAS